MYVSVRFQGPWLPTALPGFGPQSPGGIFECHKGLCDDGSYWSHQCLEHLKPMFVHLWGYLVWCLRVQRFQESGYPLFRWEEVVDAVNRKIEERSAKRKALRAQQETLNSFTIVIPALAFNKNTLTKNMRPGWNDCFDKLLQHLLSK